MNGWSQYFKDFIHLKGRYPGMGELMDSSRIGVSEAHLEVFAQAKRQQQLIYDVTGDLISRIKHKLEELPLIGEYHFTLHCLGGVPATFIAPALLCHIG